MAFRFNNRRNKNATSALGTPRAQVVYYGVWLSAIAVGAIILAILAGLIGNNISGPRNQQSARENLGDELAPPQLDYDKGIVKTVDNWEKAAAQGDTKAQAELKAALSRGQTNYQRICIGCHFGPPEATSNGPWLGNLYQTGALLNGKPMNDANVVTFILLGSQSHNLDADNKTALVNGGGGFNPMPAGIATPQQAVDIMLYLKQQTSKKTQ